MRIHCLLMGGIGLFLAMTCLAAVPPGSPMGRTRLAVHGRDQDDALDKATQAVEKLGGKVKTQKFDGKTWVDVSLRKTKVTDDQLTVLKDFLGNYNLTVDLTDTGVTDAGLKHLVKLPELGNLRLDGTQVTDAGMETVLNFFGNLTYLGLGRTKVTQKSYPQLFERFPGLFIHKDKVAQAGKYHVEEEFNRRGETKHLLWLGDTVYAMTYKKPSPNTFLKDKSRTATTYYHVDGPVGQVLKHFRPPDAACTPAALVGLGVGMQAPLTRALPGGAGQFLPAELLGGPWMESAFGVLRLNAGTYAAYGRAFQVIDFYNSAPEVEEFSLPALGKPRYFSFIQDARDRGCNVRIFRGDERRTLRDQGPRKFYCALFAEVTRDDLRDINTTLLTREAQAEFVDSLTRFGVLCYHISHRYHNLVPLIVDVASANGFAWKHGKDDGGDEGHWGSAWVMVSRRAADLEFLQKTPTTTWDVPPATGQHIWTDKGKHDLDALKWPPIKEGPL